MKQIMCAATLALAAISVVTIPAVARTAKHRVHHRHFVRHIDRSGYGYGVFPRPYDNYDPNPYDVPAISRTGRVPIGTYGEAVPFRTVQPTDVGIGALAPNGYRGPGTASGGPAGGIDNGGR